MKSLFYLVLFAVVSQLSLGGICWKRTYGRGVGTIPGSCSFDQQKQGLLCYQKCRSGYHGFLNTCAQDCPSRFRDDGLFCFKPQPYGRGGGYPWKFGDPLNDSRMYQRCERDHGRGRCEKWGAVVYPKCATGFHAAGCCVCSPNCINGMTDIGISCAKKTYTRQTILPSCGSNKEYDAGLCYTRCSRGYNGVGPVCWGTCPSNYPVQCGMACATSSSACASAISSQVLSVLEVVGDIALAVGTGGAGNAAKAAAKISAKTAIKTVAKKLSKTLTKQGIKQAIKKGAKKVGETAVEQVSDALYKASQNGEFELENLDPTGISSIVKAYNHKTCTY